MNEMEKISRALNKHSAALVQIPGVSGVYIGQNDADEFVICIMIEQKTDALMEKLPEQLDGFPVEIEETGEIKPM
ncbi:MAG: hypothetical protein GXO74_09225 [Calditrichaeota bacterium]|nr:hypothetical protein [Calditrichota bacterium]